MGVGEWVTGVDRAGLGVMRSMDDRAASVLTWLRLKRANSPVMRNRPPREALRLLPFPRRVQGRKAGLGADLRSMETSGLKYSLRGSLAQNGTGSYTGENSGDFFSSSESIRKDVCVYTVSGLRRGLAGDVCDSEQFQGTTCQTGWASLGRPHQGACLLGHGCPLTHAGLAVGSQSPRSRRRAEGPCGRSPFGSFRPVHVTRCLSRTTFSFPRGLHELRATRGRAINVCGTV